MEIIRLGKFEDSSGEVNDFLTLGLLRAKNSEYKKLADKGCKKILFEFGHITGGDFLGAMNLAHSIMKRKDRIKSIARANASSFVGSAGLYPFLACEERQGYETSIFAFHPPSQPEVRLVRLLDPYHLSLLQRRAKRYSKMIAEILRARTRWENIAEVVNAVRGDVILNGMEAEKSGVLTKLLTSE